MSGPGLLARVKQTYAGLTTYSDNATIDIEQALPGVSTTLKASHSFSTKFTRPRQFKFDFREGEGDRYVIWASGDSFFTWWKSTSVTEEYPKGEGATAFATAQLPTAGGALMVSPLLFAEAGLVGPLTGLETPEFAGAETLDGRETYKIKDDVRLNHWSDATRPTTVWIDAESFLVRKVLEERPSNTDLTDTITTIINPQTNPTIPANEYRFTPPKT
jgi:outer membrane lipoprotein-sorting protein